MIPFDSYLYGDLIYGWLNDVYAISQFVWEIRVSKVSSLSFLGASVSILMRISFSISF